MLPPAADIPPVILPFITVFPAVEFSVFLLASPLPPADPARLLLIVRVPADVFDIVTCAPSPALV